MDNITELQNIGLTEYETKVYLSLIKSQVNCATKLAEKSEVPKTKIYSVLESLANKGWIKIYSGIPLLFKAIPPKEIFEKIKENFNSLLNSIEEKIKEEEIMEKFVIANQNIGLGNLKEEIKKAKTVYISNATEEFLNEINKNFNEKAKLKIIMFPKEKIPKNLQNKAEFKKAIVEVVHLIRNKEMPSISVILDEERYFTVIKDLQGRYNVSEFLYDECNNCFREWWNLGWNSGKEIEK